MDSELFSKIFFEAEALPYKKKNPSITDRKIFCLKIGKTPFLLPSPTDNESGGTTMNDKTIH